MLGYDTIAAGLPTPDEDTPGSARITQGEPQARHPAARAAGADVVIVFPHWGVEYRAEPVEQQERLGRAAIDAGRGHGDRQPPALGGGRWRSTRASRSGTRLGNFVFDQTWSEYTMEGLTLELTFDGSDLVQARMRPHMILDKAQPNFMDPAGDGKFVMDQVWDASRGPAALVGAAPR